MQENPSSYLQIMSRLAQEYQQKYSELEHICRDLQPDEVLQQLSARAELTTDHFRAAQQAFFLWIEQNQLEQDQGITRAATTVSRCFDEMRILFNILLAHTCSPEK